MTIVKRILRYLKNIQNYVIVYEYFDDFVDYIDANHANDLSIRRSIDVYLFTFHENAII